MINKPRNELAYKSEEMEAEEKTKMMMMMILS